MATIIAPKQLGSSPLATNFLRGDGTWSTSFGAGIVVTSGIVSLSIPTSAAASINLPSGTPPSSPNAGDLCFGSGVLYFRDGTSQWKRLNKQVIVLTLCAGYTPAATGADVRELPLPFYGGDGTHSVSWVVRRINLRIQSPSTGTATVAFEYSAGTGVFSATSMGSISVSGSSTYEYDLTPSTTLASGTKLRFNVTALTAPIPQNWTITVELEEV